MDKDVELLPTPESPLRSLEEEVDLAARLGEMSPKLRSQSKATRSGSSSNKKKCQSRKGKVRGCKKISK